MRVTTVAVQVLSGVQLHQGGDECNDNKDCNRETINVLTDVEFHSTVLPPCPCLDDWFNVCLFSGSVYSLNPFLRSTAGEDKCEHH